MYLLILLRFKEQKAEPLPLTVSQEAIQDHMKAVHRYLNQAEVAYPAVVTHAAVVQAHHLLITAGALHVQEQGEGTKVSSLSFSIPKPIS